MATAKTAKTTTAKPKATKEKPAAPAKKPRAKPKPKDVEPDLLEGLDDESTEPDDEEDSDLLDEITEDDGTPWYPWEEEDQPSGVQVTVTSVDTIQADPQYSKKGEDLTRPFVQGEDKEGTLWSFRGYSTVMQRQLDEWITKGLKPGDIFAIKYLGEYVNNGPATKNKKGEYPSGTYHKVKARAQIK